MVIFLNFNIMLIQSGFYRNLGDQLSNYFYLMISTLLFLLPYGFAEEKTRGFGVVVKDTTGNKITEYSGSHALLIGVSKYTKWPQLLNIEKEIQYLEASLKRRGFKVKVVSDPDSKTLKSSFEEFINDHGFDEDNRLLFFFAGHGYSRKNNTRGYLVPVDAPDPRADEKGFLQAALTMNQVLTWSKNIESKHALFLFDSCFSGTIFKSRDLPKTPPHISNKISKPVRQFISAGSAGQTVPAKSVFTPSFVKGIQGEADYNKDGYVTGTELGMYLTNQVPKYAESQTPQYGKIRDMELDEGDFVFILGDKEKLNAKVIVKNPEMQAKVTVLESMLREELKKENWPKVKELSEKVLNLKPTSELAKTSLIKALKMSVPTPVPPTKKPVDIKESIVQNIESAKFDQAVESLKYINDLWAEDIKVFGKFHKVGTRILAAEAISTLDILDFKNELNKVARLKRLWGDPKSQWYTPSHKVLSKLRRDLFNKLLAVTPSESSLQLVNQVQNFSRLFTEDQRADILKLIKKKYSDLASKKVKKLGFANTASNWPVGEENLPENLTIKIGNSEFEFVLIPQGKLLISEGKTEVEVIEDAFYISKWEVTNRQYFTFTDATGYSAPDQRDEFTEDQQPVTSISHLDASHFCRWFNNKIFRGKSTKVDLPSEMQYHAASIGISSRSYTWGEIYKNNAAFYSDNSDGYPNKSIESVGGDSSFYGIKNLSGNVSEWCKDSWSDSLIGKITSGTKNYIFQNEGDLVLAKGGNFTSDKNELPVNFRQKFSRDSNWNMVGFRIVIINPGKYAE